MFFQMAENIRLFYQLIKKNISSYIFPCPLLQVLLRKLHSLHSIKATNLSQGPSILPGDSHDTRFSSLKELNVPEGSRKALKAKYQPNQGSVAKQAVLKFSERIEPCFWWFRTFTLKFGNARLVVSNGKIFLGCLILLMCHVVRKKKALLKRYYILFFPVYIYVEFQSQRL